MRLALGTANLGQRYGVANSHEPSEMDALEIIRVSYSHGIRDFDTAPNYVQSEDLLRKASLGSDSRIQIKIPKSSTLDIHLIRKYVSRSLNSLGVERVDSILFHDPLAYELEGFVSAAIALLDENYTSNVGLSCYSGEQAIEAYSKCNYLSVFQVPENLLDRRLSNGEEMSKLSDMGCAIQVRSIFLQGLLLMDPEEIPRNLSPCKKQILQLHQFAAKENISVTQLCISYAMRLDWAESLVVGANSVEQLNQILHATENIIDLDWDQFEAIPEPLVDPRNW